jgi:hypothetical protein
MWVMQAHHIHTGCYDKFFGPGFYGRRKRGTWHRVATLL